MKASLRNCISFILSAAAVTTTAALADSIPPLQATDPKPTIDDNFRSGHFETTLTSGPMFSPIGNPQGRAVIDYAYTGLQLGIMLSEPSPDGGLFRGNFEIAPEGFGSAIYNGIGTYIAGSTLWFRYNFVPHDWKVIPYVQAGGGFTLTDTDRYLIGQNFNFNVDGGVGLRYFICPHCTVNLEYRFQHISNANTGPKNVGINANGPIAGLSWFF